MAIVYIPQITSVSLSPNPVDAGASLTIQVTATVIEKLVYPVTDLYAVTGITNGSIFSPNDFGNPDYTNGGN